MSRFFDLISKPAREMGLYSPVPPSPSVQSETEPRLVKLDSNENPFGPSPNGIEAMKLVIANSSAYPDDDCGELCRALAAYHHLPAAHIIVTAGSAALFRVLRQTLLGPRLN